MQQIANNYGGRHCLRTVHRILKDFYERGFVRGLHRKRGQQHADRMLDALAWECLFAIVQEGEQFRVMDIAIHKTLRLGRAWSIKSVSLALKESGHVLKMTHIIALETRPAQQALFREIIDTLVLLLPSLGTESGSGRGATACHALLNTPWRVDCHVSSSECGREFETAETLRGWSI
jgi:hypothetical protein